MIASSAARRAWLSPRLWLPLAVLLAIVGLKFWQIDRYGSDLPYWDQWDAEGDHLLQPYVEGRLHAADLFQPHNEHRPVLTRLLALGLFKLNERIWDARVEMLANALLHAATALLLLALARRFLPPALLLAFAALLVALFGHVISWENTLAGFQSQFYFILLFSALHLAATLLAAPRSRAWWLAPLAGLAALFSTAAGLLSALAILAVTAARIVRDRRGSRDDLYVVGCNVALFVLGWSLKVDHPGHEHLKAANVGTWLDAFLHQFSWPVIDLWAAPFGLLPFAVLAWVYFRRREREPVLEVLLGASAWFVLQSAAIAYGRGAETHGYSSRYCDTLSCGLALDLLCIGYLATSTARPAVRRGWLWFGAVFVGITLFGLKRETQSTFHFTLDFMPELNATRIANVRHYVDHHDPAFFKKIPWDELPYPDVRRLADLLDRPTLRDVLPVSVRPAIDLAPVAAAPTAFMPWTPGEPPGPTPLELKAWRNAPGNDARLVSRSFHVTRSRLTLFVACDGAGSNALELVAADGRRLAPLGALPSAPRWKRINFAPPPGEYHLEATHAGAGWMALTAPLETTALPTLAARIPRLGIPLLIAGGVLGLFCAVSIVRFRPPPKLIAHMRRSALALPPLILGLSLGCIVLDRLGRISHQAPPRPADGFGLTDPVAPERPDARFAGAAFIQQGTRDFWWGTYVNGDGFTGSVTSTRFPIHAATLRIPILGYPNTPSTHLALEILDEGGRPAEQVAFEGTNPKEIQGMWRVGATRWIGREARLVLTDRSTAPGGWLAVSTPLQGDQIGSEWLYGIPRSYAWFSVSALACIGLLFLPGLALRTWWPARFPFGPAFLALPGLFALATLGLLIWLLGPARMHAIALAWLAVHGLVAIALTLRWLETGGPFRRAETAALGIYASVVVGALAFGVLPLGVAQEYDFHTSGQARMIASPPDHIIPYRTAVYFFHGKARQDRAVYFGDDWSVTSRGPLAPLMINAALVLFGAQPTDPPSSTLERWPTPSDGFYLARIIGVLTNALVILAGAALAAQVAPAAERAVLGWLAVAPVIAINTDFLWPKLLATFFFFLALRAVLANQPLWRAAAFGALAYFSHPVGALFMPPLVLFIGDQAGRKAAPTGAPRPFALRRMAGFTLIFVACLLPWLAFKAWVGGHDVFADYPLGDGRGFQHAASIGSWLRCRWDNLWITLLPGGFFLSDNMPSWLQGPLSQPLRWAVGYAKSLPGALGLAGFAIAIGTAWRRGSPFPPGFRRHLFLGAFLLLLVFWGFGGDGLGRNCLEPLAVLTVVYVAMISAAWRGLRWILLLVMLEAVSVRVIGVICAPSFSPAEVDRETIMLAAVTTLATLAPLAWFAAGAPESIRPLAPSPTQAAS